MTVNGEKITLTESKTLSAYVKEAGYNPERIAVEKNGEIVPKSMYDENILTEDDTLEIVHFVGGG